VVVLAEDIIWSERLGRLLRAVGAEPVVVRDRSAFEAATHDATGAIVDLTTVRVQALAAIAQAHAAGVRVLAVGQHDDVALRKRALAAGAERVYAYRKLFEDGESTLRTWLSRVPSRA
jgi:hypothetical protein